MAQKKKTKKKAALKKTKKAAKKKAAAKAASKKAASKKAAVKKTAKKTIKRAVKKPAKKLSVETPSSAGLSPKTPASLMKRKELLKKILLRKRAEVVAGIEARMGQKLTREAGQKIDSAMDSADQSAQDVDQGIDYSIIEMKYEQYKDIADAFRKLQNDTYGLCEECGGEIAIKRLEVNPFARYCIECKTRKEEIEKIQKEETRFKE